MGSDPLMAALGLRINLIAYPVVALSKVGVVVVWLLWGWCWLAGWRLVAFLPELQDANAHRATLLIAVYAAWEHQQLALTNNQHPVQSTLSLHPNCAARVDRCFWTRCTSAC